MALRLSVVMIHSPPPLSPGMPRVQTQQISEQIVGELIGVAGIDLTLIGPIAQLGEASSDRLTLDSLTGDVAVLDWHPAGEIERSLSEIGFVGNRNPHPHDQDVDQPSDGGRRIYAFDLSRFASATEVIRALTQLQSVRQIRTFSLGPPPATGTPTGKRGGDSVLGTQTATKPPQNDPDGGQAADPTTGKTAGHPGVQPAAVAASPENLSDSPPAVEEIDLDGLLDELERLDP